MAAATRPKVVAVMVSIRVPRQLKDEFLQAARMISEIIPSKPVIAEDLISFTLLKETTATIVIEYLEWAQNCDNSVRSVRHRR